MIIDFDKDSHTYSVNGDIATISVTELLSKHKLGTDYSSVSLGILQAKSEFGIQIHQELENVSNLPNFEPTTPFGINFKEWLTKNVDSCIAELSVGYFYKDLIIAGTTDLIGFLKSGEPFISDHKITATLNKEYVSWQISLLNYMFKKLNGEKLNGRPFNWKGSQQQFVLHYNKDTGDMKVVELELISDDEIEKLLECELNGTIYQRPVLVVDNELLKEIQIAENWLSEVETQYKQAKGNAELLRTQLLELFETQNIKSWENDKLKVTYVSPSESVTIDSAKLKKELPNIYGQYSKITKRKSYLLFKEKENELD